MRAARQKLLRGGPAGRRQPARKDQVKGTGRRSFLLLLQPSHSITNPDRIIALIPGEERRVSVVRRCHLGRTNHDLIIHDVRFCRAKD